jgi:sorbitol-specific phosphotransferase system component IIC
MSTWLISIIGVVYFVVACDQFVKGGVGTGIMFLGYALGNVGLVMVAK